MYSFEDRGGGGRKTLKLPQKVYDGKRSLSIINVHLPFLYIICHCLDFARRKIRLIECNAKCRDLKNLPVKGHCGRCFICLRLPPLL